jgi:hypothetical protein
MHTSDRKRESISTTIEEWRDVAFQFAHIKPHMAATPQFHPLETLEGKESKNLQEHSARLETLLDRSCTNIIETISLQHWTETDLTCPPQEQSILKNWNLTLKHRVHPPLLRITSLGTTPLIGPLLLRILSN